MINQIARMEEVVQSYLINNQFMGSILVSQKDRILLNKGYGYANLEWQIPNSPTTKFRLGSITKQFTAAAILLLEEQGKLKITDLLKKYIPDIPNAWNNITIFHLLTHTSGIPNCTAVPDFNTFVSTTKSVKPMEQMELVNNKPLQFEPGSQFDYCNSGYVLLGYLIEMIAGQSYKDFIGNNLFKPYGMHDSGYDSNSEVILHRASGYEMNPTGIINAEYLNSSIPYAAGSLYSTTQDLLQWVQALFEEKILSPESFKKMTTPFKMDYSFGLFFQSIDSYKFIFHGGGINGFKTMLMYCPEDKLTVAILSNIVTLGFSPHEIVIKIVKLAHGKIVTLPSERKAIILSSDILIKYVGTYNVKQMNINITLENGNLMAQFTDQLKFQLYPESETDFFGKIPDTQIVFLKDEQDKIFQLTLHQYGQELTGIKLVY